MRSDFWIVIPAYREAVRLPPYLRALGQALGTAPFTARIQVVDDGSPIADRAMLESAINKCRREFPHLNALHILPVNRGKGAAVRAGWDLAPADVLHLAFLDADGSVPASEVVRVLGTVPPSSTDHAWFGSRRRMPGRNIERVWFRHAIGRVFAFCVSTLFSSRIYDSQCGFKCIPHEVYRRIGHQLHENRFVFDVELLVVLRAAGCHPMEIPIDWSHTPGGKVSLSRDAPAMLLGLIRIRLRHLRAHASRPPPTPAKIKPSDRRDEV